MSLRHVAVAVVAVLVLAVSTASACCPKGPDTAAAFEKLKSLDGRWVGTMGEGSEATPAQIIYQVVSGGSAVMAREFPGTPHEMVTLYYLDGEDLYLTHYCAVGNQPTMKLAEAQGSRLVFEFVDGTNMDRRIDGYMGRAVINVLSGDDLKEEWTFFDGYKPGSTHVMVMTRAAE